MILLDKDELEEFLAHPSIDFVKLSFLEIGPMTPIYRKLMKDDDKRRKYAFFPLMATCGFGELGALNAESFCERVISGSNLIMNSGNTRTNDALVEKLVVLRMN